MTPTNTGALLYLFFLVTLAAVLALAVVSDLVLWLGNQPTMSSWLRTHPEWFFVPACFLAAGVFALAVHLKP